jgi:hypothetical protein
MSQLDTPPFGAAAVEPQKTSGLAIASLVCSLICCVPVTTIPGILMGIAAMISIGGIVLGALFTIGQALIYPPAIGYIRETMQMVYTGPSAALASGFGGDTAAFRDQFYGAGAAATDAEAQAFLEELRDRYGEYMSCNLDETAQPSQPRFGTPMVPFPYVIEFADGQVQAEAEIVFSDPVRGGFINKLGYITVFDTDLGDLTYPASAEGAMDEPMEEPAGMPDEAPTEEDGG